MILWAREEGNGDSNDGEGVALYDGGDNKMQVSSRFEGVPFQYIPEVRNVITSIYRCKAH